jgi:hypothetical protein
MFPKHLMQPERRIGELGLGGAAHSSGQAEPIRKIESARDGHFHEIS